MDIFFNLAETGACESVQPRIIGGKDALPREKIIINKAFYILIFKMCQGF